MTPLPAPPRHRRTARLTVQSLEDRATPATFAYSAYYQALTVTALDGEQIEVTRLDNQPTGYLKVREAQGGQTVFDSSLAKQNVRSLTVKFTGDSGGFNLAADVKLGGDLTLAGAKVIQTADVLGTVGGNFTYTAAPGPRGAAATGPAFDVVNLGATAQVGGSVWAQLGAGQNTVRLKGGTVRGNLTLLGGADPDTVELAEDGDLAVNGSVNFNLGGGANAVNGKGLAHRVQVKGSFTYTGGDGNDTIDLDGAGTALAVGGSAWFNLGPWNKADTNLAKFEALSAGGSITFTGGGGSDTVLGSGGILAGGNLTLNLGNGDNTVDTDGLGTGLNEVGGSLVYTGGSGTDQVTLDALTVGRNLTVTLGDAGVGTQALNVGTRLGSPVSVFGNVWVSDGAGGSNIALARTYVGWALTVLAGAGDDTVQIDDTDVAGPTRIDLGAGTDTLAVEVLSANNGGPLGAAGSFGGTLTVLGGDGDDTVTLSADGDASTRVRFGARVWLYGGKGADTLRNAAENPFSVTANFTDFEDKGLVPLP